MKKIISLIALILLISLIATTFVACGGDVDESGFMTLVVKTATI